MLFALMVPSKKRNRLNNFLNKNGIYTRICWTPVHKQIFHSKLFPKSKFDGAETIHSKIINLPMGNGLSKNDVNHVIKIVKKGFNKIN